MDTLTTSRQLDNNVPGLLPSADAATQAALHFSTALRTIFFNILRTVVKRHINLKVAKNSCNLSGK